MSLTQVTEDSEITARFSRQELVRAWRALTPSEPRSIPVVRIGLKTDLGCARDNNEDKAEFYEPADRSVLATRGSVYVVADGMGGHAAGQIASEMAIKRFLAKYYDSPTDDPDAALADATAEANAHVYGVASSIPSRSGMGTTLTALALIEDRAFVCHVGDSRAYLLRDGAIRQITEDHSWVAEQVRLGALTEQEAELSPYRNIITRCIGPQPEVEPDVSAIMTEAGDRWLLCTDGLTGYVGDDELASIASDESPSEVCRQLVELACARGGRDNVTVLCVWIDELRSQPPVSVGT